MSRYDLSRAHVAAFTRGFAAIGLTVLLALGGPVRAQERDDGGGIAAIGHTFTYQGVVKQSGTPINGSCDLQFSLWSAAAWGACP